MLILMAFNFAFWIFSIGEFQNPQFAKNHIYKFFEEKKLFFAICEFWGSPIEKIMKAKLNGIRISIS